jgi:hypothetical protein
LRLFSPVHINEVKGCRSEIDAKWEKWIDRKGLLYDLSRRKHIVSPYLGRKTQERNGWVEDTQHVQYDESYEDGSGPALCTSFFFLLACESQDGSYIFHKVMMILQRGH